MIAQSVIWPQKNFIESSNSQTVDIKQEESLPIESLVKDTGVGKHITELLSPKLIITTSIKAHQEGHDISKAYVQGDFFWGKDLEEKDYIQISLEKAKKITSIVIPSGNDEHKLDALLDSTLSFSNEINDGQCVNYQKLDEFRDKPVVRYAFKEPMMISCIRLTIDKIRKIGEQKYWLVVSGITVS